MKFSFACWALAVISGLGFDQAGAATFTPLGDLAGGTFHSEALDVSGDGSTVVGVGRSSSGKEAFRWTRSDGMVGLGDLPGSRFQSEATGVSNDGSVIAGNGRSTSGAEAFLWTADNGMVGLGDLPGSAFFSEANDISGDGKVVVGISRSDNGIEAFRWTVDGMEGIGDLDGDVFSSRANGTNEDGSVVVGRGSSYAGLEAFEWSVDNGIFELGFPIEEGIAFNSEAYAVSPNGNFYVGDGLGPGGFEAAFWDAGFGFSIGDLAGASDQGAPRAVTDAGFVVGSGSSEVTKEAMFWDFSKGDDPELIADMNPIRNLKKYLVDDFDLDLSGWLLSEATGISADGNTIVGFGQNPDGNREAWLVDLVGSSLHPCDFDGDGEVGFADFVMFSNVFGQSADGDNAKFDKNKSGTVDFGDFVEFSINFGATGSTVAVPEPSSVALLLLSGLAIIGPIRFRTPNRR